MASLTLRKAVEAALEHFKANADLLGAVSSDVTFEEAELSELRSLKMRPDVEPTFL